MVLMSKTLIIKVYLYLKLKTNSHFKLKTLTFLLKGIILTKLETNSIKTMFVNTFPKTLFRQTKFMFENYNFKLQ